MLQAYTRSLSYCALLLVLLHALPGTHAKSIGIPGSQHITDLNISNFNSTLLGLDPEQYVLCEFYASWCPHCRHFGPEMAKAAEFLAKHVGGKQALFIARVDCAVEVKLCNQYGVQGYPQVTLATAEQFLDVSKKQLKTFPLKFREADAKHVVAWVGSSLNRSLPEYKEEAVGKLVGHVGAAAPSNTTWDLHDVESATMMLMRQSMAGMKGPHARSALLDLLLLWTAAHPSPRCAEGAGKLQAQLPSIWPATSASPGVELQSFHICGEAEEREWASCKGSEPKYRGYTCGLWTMWHTTSVRLPEANGGRLLIAALNAFAAHFFQCEECRQHFSALLAHSNTAWVVTRRDAVMWLWKTHNKVNARIAEEEKRDGSGDPAFVKVQFPPFSMCPQCRKKGQARLDLHRGDWDEDKVYTFLIRHYGPGSTAESSGKVLPEPKGTAGTTHELILGANGQQLRPGSRWHRGRWGHVRTWVAVIAMALIMAWYCSKAKRRKAHAGNRASVPQITPYDGRVVNRRKSRSVQNA